jgi:hypothetical protein
VVAVGDLHGDLAATRAALRLAGAVDEADAWVGGRMTLVQTGDQLDRGDDERAIVDMFDRLSVEAAAAGGAVVALVGNHELMNVAADFRYCRPTQLAAFSGVSTRSPLAAALLPEHRSRGEAFMPGGEYALRLSRRPVAAVVGDTVFAHGGVLPEHLAHGLDRYNQEARDWMTGRSGAEPPPSLSRRDSPLWTRAYGGDVSPEACGALSRTLAALGAARLVVGHTVQERGISPACGGQVWRIDVALSRGLDRPGRKVQVLEMVGAEARPLTAP